MCIRKLILEGVAERLFYPAHRYNNLQQKGFQISFDEPTSKRFFWPDPKNTSRSRPPNGRRSICVPNRRNKLLKRVRSPFSIGRTHIADMARPSPDYTVNAQYGFQKIDKKFSPPPSVDPAFSSPALLHPPARRTRGRKSLRRCLCAAHQEKNHSKIVVKK